MTDNDLMPWGKHKNKKMKDVPSQYLLWLYEAVEDDGAPEDGNCVKESVLNYIEDNLDEIEKENENDS
ncbi:MAG: putative quorum-sensing-regulated virulence factor [Candidatus Heimdallarchaeaceae archaeon]